jgi:hypothetical protein
MSHSFGDLTDAQLLDELKKGGNSVHSGILPMLTQNLPMAKGGPTGWQDESADANDFRNGAVTFTGFCKPASSIAQRPANLRKG